MRLLSLLVTSPPAHTRKNVTSSLSQTQVFSLPSFSQGKNVAYIYMLEPLSLSPKEFG